MIRPWNFAVPPAAAWTANAMSLQKESVAVITGAASGIGRALARRFADEGLAGIAIADINADDLTETKNMIAGTTRGETIANQSPSPVPM